MKKMIKNLIITVVSAVLSTSAVAADNNAEMSGDWQKISLNDVKNPATLFGEDWAALAAGKKGSMNAMTIGWGQFGVLWGRPVVTVYVAPERYTNEFMENNEYFTVTAFSQDYKKALQYIGTHSGRDGDKLKEAGLNAEYTELGNPIFKEGNLAVEGKTIYKEEFKSELLDDKATAFYEKTKLHPHVAYIGEVVNVWRKGE